MKLVPREGRSALNCRPEGIGATGAPMLFGSMPGIGLGFRLRIGLDWVGAAGVSNCVAGVTGAGAVSRPSSDPPPSGPVMPGIRAAAVPPAGSVGREGAPGIKREEVPCGAVGRFPAAGAGICPARGDVGPKLGACGKWTGLGAIGAAFHAGAGMPPPGGTVLIGCWPGLRFGGRPPAAERKAVLEVGTCEGSAAGGGSGKSACPRPGESGLPIAGMPGMAAGGFISITGGAKAGGAKAGAATGGGGAKDSGAAGAGVG